MQSQLIAPSGIFDYPAFCRAWAQAYKPFHQTGRKTLQNCCLLHDTIDERGEIVKKLVNVQDNGLFMSVITAFDGGLFALTDDASRPNFYSWRRHALFWAKAIDPTEEAAASAKLLAVETAQDFIAFISAVTDKHLTPSPPFQVDWQDGPPTVATLPVSFNGWYVASVSFTQLHPRQKCLVPDRYDTDALAAQFPFLSPKLFK